MIAYAHRRPAVFCLWLTAAISLVFLVFPTVDQAVSAWFYDTAEGFLGPRNETLRAVRELGLFTPKLIVGVLVAALLLKIALPYAASLIPVNVSLFLISSLIIGPGLLVNGVLKAHWGRPRPRNTDLFGGDLPFMPPWLISNHCADNCSFVSGEASSSFWVLAFAFVVPKEWRVATLSVLIPYVVIMSFNRVIFGGHYFSDVLIAWTLNFLILLFAYRFWLADPPPAVRPERMEARLTHLGLGLRRLVGLGHGPINQVRNGV